MGLPLNRLLRGSLASEARKDGYTVHEAVLDVTDEASVADAFAKFDEQRLNVDILVNNAGIQIRGPLLDFPAGDFRKVIDTNLISAFLPRFRVGDLILSDIFTHAFRTATRAPLTYLRVDRCQLD